MIDPDRVLADLEVDEGFKPHVYKDSEGYDTIGHGILVDARKGGGITVDESRMLLRNRLMLAIHRLDKLRPGWRIYPGRVSDALANMAYQMGADGLNGFTKMWAALDREDFEAAADEALDSKWAKQTPNRARRMANLIRSA